MRIAVVVVVVVAVPIVENYAALMAAAEVDLVEDVIGAANSKVAEVAGDVGSLAEAPAVAAVVAPEVAGG